MKKTFYTRALAACKLFFRRLTLRLLRKLLDLADDRLHAAEVRLRDELAAPVPGADMVKLNSGHAAGSNPTAGAAKKETFQQWEAGRSGVAPASKKEARRRRALSAAEFDLRFAR
jgi:hypothetical protein